MFYCAVQMYDCLAPAVISGPRYSRLQVKKHCSTVLEFRKTNFLRTLGSARSHLIPNSYVSYSLRIVTGSYIFFGM